MSADTLSVEVAYVGEAGSYRLRLSVPAGMTVRGVIERSRILDRAPEIDLARNTVGVYSKPCGLEDLAADNMRIEIYRALLCDPKESRRRRSERRKLQS